MSPRQKGEDTELQLSFRQAEDPRVVHEEKGLRYLHKIRLAAGMLPCEGAAFFEHLYMLPVLQTLGTPVALVTLPGCISASVAMLTLPVCGRFIDKGSNPRRRKRPAVVCAVAVLILGLTFILLANALHIWDEGPSHRSSPISNHQNLTATGNMTAENFSRTILAGKDFENGTVQQSTLADFAYLLHDEVGSGNASSDASGRRLQTDVIREDPDVASDQSGLGIPPLALIAMMGFVLLDLAYDLTNVSVKTYMISYSPRLDHVSLLVLGVFMAAVGGCCTAVTGLIDLGSLITDAPWAAQVCKQAIVQVSTLIALTVVCTLCSVLSAPQQQQDQCWDRVSLEGGTDAAEHVTRGGSDGTGQEGDEGSVMVVEHSTLTTDMQENLIMATASPADVLGLSTSTQVDHPLLARSISVRFHHFHDKSDIKDSITASSRKSYNSITLSQSTTTRSSSSSSSSSTRETRKSCLWPSRTTFNLAILLTSSFFMSCGSFVYNITMIDYLGKVVFGGDPKEGNAKQELYQQGVQTGSLGLLIINIVYMIFSLVHHKVLSILGPKVEYLGVSAAMVSLLLIYWLTNSLAAFYVTSAVMGLSRAVLNTIPFMMANEQCQKETETLSGKGSHPPVGSFLGLVTCAMPCAWLVVSAITGPLMDVTGEPAAPLLFGIVCVVFGAALFPCYRF